MKIVATLGPVDAHGCRNVEFEIESGGDMRLAATYNAGILYLRQEHAEPLLRKLEGSSGAFVGDVEIRG